MTSARLDFPRLRRRALESIERDLLLQATPADLAWLHGHVERLRDPNCHSFVLPADGEIIDPNTPFRLTLEACRLPFTRCALEFVVTPRPSRQGVGIDKWFPKATLLVADQPLQGGDISLSILSLTEHSVSGRNRESLSIV